jgi:hypothetical protein
MPVGRLEVTVLHAGEASSVLVRMPDGRMWGVDGGAVRGSVGSPPVAGALRQEGERRVAGLVLTALDEAHASAGGELIERLGVGRLMVSGQGWERRGETLAGARVEAAANLRGVEVTTLTAGKVVLADGAQVEVLWPPAAGENLGRADLVVCVSYGGRRVLIADPRAERALARALSGREGFGCDVMVFTGVERGAPDGGLRALAKRLGAAVVWTGRGPWAPRATAAGEWNVAEGAVSVVVESAGVRVARAAGVTERW